MSPFVKGAFLDSEVGVITPLSAAGTSVENPYAYDSAARELKDLASQGLVEITEEHCADEALISNISFKRLR